MSSTEVSTKPKFETEGAGLKTYRLEKRFLLIQLAKTEERGKATVMPESLRRETLFLRKRRNQFPHKDLPDGRSLRWQR